MSENLMPAFGPVEHEATQTSSAARPHRPAVKHVRSSPLARQLSSTRVQILDKGAIQLALALTLFDTPLLQGQTFTGYLLARVSTRNLLIGTALLVVWRVLY